MSEEQAERVATVLLGVAIVGAAVYVLRTPELRRTVWQAARNMAAMAGPALVNEARRAWQESERAV